MITVHGLHGVKAIILADSVNAAGNRLITYELEYPRIIHAELLTHGMLSRNSASSRAIPFAKMKEQLKGRPVRFGANQSGMQDKGEHAGLVEGRQIGMGDAAECFSAEDAWELAKADAMFWSEAFSNAGYHKQVFNRLTECFQMMKVVLSGTEYANFFWLRHHDAADPSLQELARCMYEARELSKPILLKPGQWHLPYVNWIISPDGVLHWQDTCGTYVSTTWEDLIKVSAARSAAVSYRNEDYTMEKSKEVYERLVGADRKHASAFEHQATPMADMFIARDTINTASFNLPGCPDTWEKGISHMDRNGKLWSAKFCGFLQYRKLIPGENYEGKQ